MNNKGQIAIFVIIAIIIIAGILMFFLVDRTPKIQRGQDYDNPESFIDSCVKKATSEGVKFLLENGGLQNPTDYVIYDDKKVIYLCKNLNNYEPCINQRPGYIREVERELNDLIKVDVSNCFSLLEEELVQKNYGVSAEGLIINTTIKPNDVVEVKVERKLSISKGDVIRNYKEFRTLSRESIYDLIFIANEITAQEAKFCYFSNDGFMVLYPDYDIRKDVLSDSTKIYTIKDKSTKQELKIAIRGCAIPYGF